MKESHDVCSSDTYDETTEDSHRDPDEKSFPTLAEMSINRDQDVIICCHKLPVQLTKVGGKWKALPTCSVILSCLYNISQKNTTLTKSIWIGHPGINPKSEIER